MRCIRSHVFSIQGLELVLHHGGLSVKFALSRRGLRYGVANGSTLVPDSAGSWQMHLRRAKISWPCNFWTVPLFLNPTTVSSRLYIYPTPALLEVQPPFEGRVLVPTEFASQSISSSVYWPSHAQRRWACLAKVRRRYCILFLYFFFWKKYV